MPNILHIDASAHYDTSTSRMASAQIVADLGGTVTYRDLSDGALPFVDATWADARLKAPEDRTLDEAAALALSDELIKELQDADTIVIGSPIYNFAGPASLKAWMDLVARPRVTFHYTENGPEGLLKDKKAIIAVASGGVSVGSDADFLTSHLKFFLGFIGITDVEIHTAKDLIAA